jgi:Mrp family chromosome partitioning ATPase
MIGAGMARLAHEAEQSPLPNHNIPVLLTSLIGRARELEVIGQTPRASRLATLTGPGGVGKTRLAVALARGAIVVRVGGRSHHRARVLRGGG